MEISETIPNTGVDPTSKWIMVPAKGYSWFTLLKPRGVTVVRKTGLVSIHKVSDTNKKRLTKALEATTARFAGGWSPPNVRELIRRAEAKGGAVYFIRARGMGTAGLQVKGGAKTARIGVSVHAARTIKVTLNRVLHRPDGKGDVSHGRHSIEELQKIVWVTNGVLGPQTNVKLAFTVRDVRYDGNLGDHLKYTIKKGHEDLKAYNKLVEMGDSSARINVHVVNGYKEGEQKQSGSVHTNKTHPYNIIFSTKNTGWTITRMGQILAHELCHAVMYPSWRGSIHLGQSERGLMHPARLLGTSANLRIPPVSHEDLKLRSGRTKTFYERASGK